MTELPRLARCGAVLHGGAEFVTVVLDGDGVAGLRGVQTCGSVWACAVCSARIRQARAVEVERAALAHLAAGGELAFLTFTLPHSVNDGLRSLLDALNFSWKRVQQGAAWKRLRADHGLGFVRATEITDGRNGWHPHLHVLLLLDRPLEDGGLRALEGQLEQAWSAAVVREGRGRPNQHGTRLQPVTGAGGAGALARYLSKVQDDGGDSWSVGAELVRGDLKAGRRSDRMVPFDLLDRAQTDRRALARWHEYEQATLGRHCMTWSRGLKARYDVAEVADEQIVDPGEAVAALSRLDWRTVVTYNAEVRVLDAAERARAAGADPGAAVHALMRRLWRRHDWEARCRCRKASRAGAVTQPP